MSNHVNTQISCPNTTNSMHSELKHRAEKINHSDVLGWCDAFSNKSNTKVPERCIRGAIDSVGVTLLLNAKWWLTYLHTYWGVAQKSANISRRLLLSNIWIGRVMVVRSKPILIWDSKWVMILRGNVSMSTAITTHQLFKPIHFLLIFKTIIVKLRTSLVVFNSSFEHYYLSRWLSSHTYIFASWQFLNVLLVQKLLSTTFFKNDLMGNETLLLSKGYQFFCPF